MPGYGGSLGSCVRAVYAWPLVQCGSVRRAFFRSIGLAAFLRFYLAGLEFRQCFLKEFLSASKICLLQSCKCLNNNAHASSKSEPVSDLPLASKVLDRVIVKDTMRL